jgi:hypothetical protein
MPRSSVTSCSSTTAPLVSPCSREHDGAPAERDLDAGREALPDRVRERLALGLVDHRHDLGERLAADLGQRATEQLLGGAVQVVDAAVGVGRDEPVAERVERRLRAAALRGVRAARDHLDRREQHGRLTVVAHDLAGELEPRHLAVRVGDLDLVALRGRLAGEAAADVVGHELGVLGRDELGERPADQLRDRPAGELGAARVREQDAVGVHEHGLVHDIDELAEQGLGWRRRRAVALEGLVPVELGTGVYRLSTPPPRNRGGKSGEDQRSHRDGIVYGQQVLPTTRTGLRTLQRARTASTPLR